MALFARARLTLIGDTVALPSEVIARYPELQEGRYRRGGLPPRVAGWFLGVRSVAGIALMRTVWLGADAPLTPDLLLHELAHVRQWRTVRGFALRYVWESLRHGYARNRFEIDACDFARTRASSP